MQDLFPDGAHPPRVRLTCKPSALFGCKTPDDCLIERPSKHQRHEEEVPMPALECMPVADKSDEYHPSLSYDYSSAPSKNVVPPQINQDDASSNENDSLINHPLTLSQRHQQNVTDADPYLIVADKFNEEINKSLHQQCPSTLTDET